MKRLMAGALVIAVLLTIALAPSDAWARGGGRHHRGGVHVGIWGPGLFIGGLALGAAVTAPYRYHYPYPYYYYGPPDYYYAPPPTVIYQQAPTTYVVPPAPVPAPVQREVVYSHGKYVLYGDGVTQAWQWVWVPSAPVGPPPPPPAR